MLCLAWGARETERTAGVCVDVASRHCRTTVLAANCGHRVLTLVWAQDWCYSVTEAEQLGDMAGCDR
eukprot:2235985-Amphidinium_carterae.3